MMVLKRIAQGELNIVNEKPTRKLKPHRDYRNRLCTFNQMSRVIDPRFPQGDQRRTVAKLHRHLTDSGEPGFSGKYDPKSITTSEGVKYMEMLKEPNSTCDLCEAGDMISPWRRHVHSKYCPGTRVWHVWWKRARLAMGRFRAIIRL
jgi:hypothetical protein